MIRVGVCGLGSIGTQHARILAELPDVEVVGYDADPARGAALQADGHVHAAVATLAELIDARPAAIVLAGPDHTHMAQLQATVAAGVATLVEKPIAGSYAEALTHRAAIAGSGVPVLVGYVLRHRPVLQAVRRHVLDGAIGRPTSAHVMLGAYSTIVVARSRFATAEPDRLYRDYSHEWDYLRWIFGPVARVLAVARTATDVTHVEHPNLVDAMLQHERDVVVSCHLDYVEPRGLRTVHIVGTGGSLFADIGTGHLRLRRAGADADEVRDMAEPPAAALRRQAVHLLDVAAGRAEPIISFDDGLAALQIAEAVRDAAGTGAWLGVPHE